MIESPCTKICVLDPTARICRGCGRTGDEIANWLVMPPAERRCIMDSLAKRMAQAGLPQPSSLPTTSGE